MSRAQSYVVQSLASAGFALVDGVIAATLRPDLWHDAHQAGGDLAEAIRHHALHGLIGVTWGRARLEGLDRPVPVVTRNTDALARRIAWVTGREVLSLEQAEVPTAKPSAPVHDAVARSSGWEAAQRIEKLKKLAAQEPPEHECTQRREILKAREELARMAVEA